MELRAAYGAYFIGWSRQQPTPLAAAHEMGSIEEKTSAPSERAPWTTFSSFTFPQLCF